MSLGWIGGLTIFCAALLIVLLIVRPKPLAAYLPRISNIHLSPTGINIELAVQSAKQAITAKESLIPDDATLRRQLAALPSQHKILWVDDFPEHNSFEMEALQHLGLTIEQALTNDEAAKANAAEGYDIVITDISRSPPEAPDAGLKLPGVLSRSSSRVPPIIYYVSQRTSFETPQGFPVVSGPSELFKLVASTLRLPKN